MTPERRQQVFVLFDEMVELPPGEREAYLDLHCPDDLELRREVLLLAEAGHQAGSF